MMDHRGLSAVATAVTLLLQRSWIAGDIDGAAPEFVVYRSRDFADPMHTGLSVFVHQVSGAPLLRDLPRANAPRQSVVSVEVSFLLTAWAESASVEQSLLGWGACTLADNPVLDATLLNDAVPGVCAPGETIQLRADDSDQPVSQLWQAIPCTMQLSLPYITSALHLATG